MARIVLNEAAEHGIKGVTRKKPKMGKKYQALVQEANKKIDEDHFHYACTYKKASTYLTR